MFKKIFLVLYIFLAHNFLHASRNYISNDLLNFSYDDIKEITYIMDVSYDFDSPHIPFLENVGWDLERLYFEEERSYGVRATNGPLTVFSFSGTKDKYTLSQDADLIRLDSKVLFPNLPSSVLHRGFAQYYQNLNFSQYLNKKFDSDELLVFSGHSLGGAASNLAALDMLNTQFTESEYYPRGFCSLFTLGAPAVMGEELRGALDENFNGYSHMRVAFDNDPISRITRGEPGDPFAVCRTFSDECVFTHAGVPVVLSGSGIFTHFRGRYIDHVAGPHNQTIKALWPDISEEKFENLIREGLYGNSGSIEKKRIILHASACKGLAPTYRRAAISILSHFGQFDSRFEANIAYNLWRYLCEPHHGLEDYEVYYENFSRFYCSNEYRNNKILLDLMEVIISHPHVDERTIFECMRGNLFYITEEQYEDRLIELLTLYFEKFNFSDRSRQLYNSGISIRSEKVKRTIKNLLNLKILEDPTQNSVSKYSAFMSLYADDYRKNEELFFAQNELKRDFLGEVLEKVRLSYSKEFFESRYEILFDRSNEESKKWNFSILSRFYDGDELELFEKNHLMSNFRYLRINISQMTYDLQKEDERDRYGFGSFLKTLKKLPRSSNFFSLLVQSFRDDSMAIRDFEAFFSNMNGDKSWFYDFMSYVGS